MSWWHALPPRVQLGFECGAILVANWFLISWLPPVLHDWRDRRWRRIAAPDRSVLIIRTPEAVTGPADDVQ